MTATDATNGELRQALVAAARAAGIQAADVVSLKRLSGGASKESWSFELALEDGGTLRAVLRRQPLDQRFSSHGMASVTAEAAVIRVAEAAGVPVPEVLFELPEGSAAGDGYVMRHIDGETVGVRVLKQPELESARQGLAHRCGEVLAKLHAASNHGHLQLAELPPEQALHAMEARHRANADDRPVFEYALQWLKRHLPCNGPLVLLHGDFRNGNLVVGPEGLRAVLDWELAHIGAPAADLAWLCVNSWRFQRPDLPAGGFGTREELLDGYRAGGGAGIEMADLHAWEVFQTMNWGVMCAGAGKAFVAGHRSVEGAVIARRASETEFDLMRLLAPDHEAWNVG